MANKVVTLPSGKKLEICLASFSEANALNRAIAKELKDIKLEPGTDLKDPGFLKDLICGAYTSEAVMSALNVCLKRCQYNGNRIVDLEIVFESEEARGDYFDVCKEVLLENVRPFVKSLLSKLEAPSSVMKGE